MAIRSRATDLVDGVDDQNAGFDAFLLDRQDGSVALASRSSSALPSTGDRPTQPLRLSDGGRYLFLWSEATDLVAGVSDTNNGTDIFQWDRNDGSIRLASRSASSPSSTAQRRSFAGQQTPSGDFISFRSTAEDLVPGSSDPNSGEDWFLWSQGTGDVQLISHAAGDPTTAGALDTWEGRLSEDGSTVAFMGASIDYVSGALDGNDDYDTFVWHRATNETRLGLPLAQGIVSAWGGTDPKVDDTGRAVAFSGWVNLDRSAQESRVRGAYLWNRETGQTVLVSHAAGKPGVFANGISSVDAISPSGGAVVFRSLATDLVAGQGDGNGAVDVFLWDSRSDECRLVSHAASASNVSANGHSTPRSVSRDGRFVLFDSMATNLAPGQSEGNADSDVFLWDRTSDEITLVSHQLGSPTTTGNSVSSAVAISASGDFVLFDSRATNLTREPPPGGIFNVYLWRRSDGSITLVSHRFDSSSTAALGGSRGSALDDSGRWVAFHSDAPDLVDRPGGSSILQAYRYDAFSGTSELLTRSAVSGESGNDESTVRGMSADGKVVLISSTATDLVEGLVDEAFTSDLFVWTEGESNLRLVTHAHGSATTTANAPTVTGMLDRSGNRVAFESEASDLDDSVVEANQESPDVFVWNRATGANRIISRSSRSQGEAAGGSSRMPVFDGTGSFVAFVSSSHWLLPADYSADGAAVFLWFSGLFLDGFESGSTSNWSTTEPVD